MEKLKQTYLKGNCDFFDGVWKNKNGSKIIYITVDYGKTVARIEIDCNTITGVDFNQTGTERYFIHFEYIDCPFKDKKIDICQLIRNCKQILNENFDLDIEHEEG